MGPSNGMPEIINDAEAALMLSTSCGLAMSAPITVEHDLGLVAESLREGGAQRPVGEATREDRVLGGPAFTTEERTRDLAGCVRTLFDVDRQWEEIRPRTYVLGGVGGGQHRGAANAGHHRALTLLGKFACLEGQGLVSTRNWA